METFNVENTEGFTREELQIANLLYETRSHGVHDKSELDRIKERILEEVEYRRTAS